MSESHPFFPNRRESTAEDFEQGIKQRFCFLPGEQYISLHQANHPRYGSCDFVITTWGLRVVLQEWSDLFKDFSIPFKCMLSIEKKGGKHRFGFYGIEIALSNTATLNIPFSKTGNDRPTFYHHLKDNFSNPTSLPDMVYESDHKWIRIMEQSSHWQVVDNDFCPTYPKKILVPPDVNLDLITRVASFRSKGRLPYLSFINPDNGAALMRSSQPLTGIRNQDSPDDARYISAIVQGRNVAIFDCRPKLNAVVNILTGGGYESTDKYINSTFKFFNIPNIHKVREVYHAFSEGLANTYDPEPWKEWGDLISQILTSSVSTVNALVSNCAALVHCTDGWDRTAQICSVVQLMMDPNSRTIEGFQNLIMKEWCDAGHQFSVRCCHRPNPKLDESAPIFIQFIDCVIQLIHNNPTAFEFNIFLPILCGYHAYAQIYGDFNYRNVQERESKSRPPSFWRNLQFDDFVDFIKNTHYAKTQDNLLDVKPFFFCKELHAAPLFGSAINIPTH